MIPRIITLTCMTASLILSACEKKTEASLPLNCVAADGSAIPCPTDGAGSRTEPGGPEQQK